MLSFLFFPSPSHIFMDSRDGVVVTRRRDWVPDNRKTNVVARHALHVRVPWWLALTFYRWLFCQRFLRLHFFFYLWRVVSPSVAVNPCLFVCLFVRDWGDGLLAPSKEFFICLF